MEGQRFDEFARTLSEGVSRRTVLRRLGALAAGAGLALLGRGRGEAATCRGIGATCREHANCCLGNCGPKDRTGRRRCVCEAGEEYCGDDKCCPIGLCDNFLCLLGPNNASHQTIEMAWKAIFELNALAPALSITGFAPRTGHPFDIRTAAPDGTTTLVQAEVIEATFPTRMVFRWQTETMPEAAIGEVLFKQKEKGPRVAVNRLAGDRATCDVATTMIGRQWQKALFSDVLPKFLDRMQPE